MVQTQASKRKWVGRKAIEENIQAIVDDLHIHPLAARVLAARNMAKTSSILSFLHSGVESLLDPFLMHDMKRTVNRVHLAIQRGEKIGVVGDYDVDGVAATTIMVQSLFEMGADVSFKIPNRMKDGYGLSEKIVEELANEGVTLIVTVDCGITAVEAVNHAKHRKIDVVITDHHRIPDNRVPKAYAIVHPAFPRSLYTNHNLCGTAVAFKVAQALLGRFPEEYLELVALATVADVMPLVGENRVLLRLGLEELNRKPSVGLWAIGKVAGLEYKRIDTGHLAFQFSPRINSVGRLADASLVVHLLLSQDPEEAMKIAEHMNELNRFRQSLQNSAYEDALTQISAHPEWLESKALVVSGEYHEGVVGIVAGKIAEKFARPTLCIAVSGEHAKGSGRSGFEEFSLYNALSDVQGATTGIFTGWGGHDAAAGFSLSAENIGQLREAMEDACDRHWPTDYEPYILCDAEFHLEDLSFPLLNDLKLLEPWGHGHEEPIFFLRDTVLYDVSAMGSNAQHVKLELRDRFDRSYYITAFNCENIDWAAGGRYHFLVNIRENIWKNQRAIQLNLVDWRT